MKFDRCKKLFSNFEHIQKLNILICGVGGVGGYALDCLYKSGVKNITIIDFDIFEESNQNRQIGSEFVGEKKTIVLKRLYPQIKFINQKIDKNFIDTFDFNNFDFVIDAIDDMNAKISLIIKTHKKLISSMGAAKRINPTLIKADSIWKTTNDPFAKKIRDRLKKENFKEDFKVVYSIEKPIPCEMGSFVGVTGAFGFVICSEILGSC